METEKDYFLRKLDLKIDTLDSLHCRLAEIGSYKFAMQANNELLGLKENRAVFLHYLGLKMTIANASRVSFHKERLEKKIRNANDLISDIELSGVIDNSPLPATNPAP